MLTFDTYTRMRELSTIDAFGLGEFARFKGTSFPKYGYAIWCKNHENVAIQGAPAFFYASSGVPDGRVMYNEDGTGALTQASCVGAFAYNGTVNFTTTANYPNAYGYCWIQTFGLSSASALVWGAGNSAAEDVVAGDLLWPSPTDGTWYAYGNSATEYRTAVAGSATLYAFNGAPIGLAIKVDVTSTGVLAAASVVWHSPWCAGAGL